MTSPSRVRYRPVLVDDEPQAHVSSDSCLELLDLPPELRPLIVEQLHRVVDRACLKEACHALHRAWPRLPKLRVEDIGPRAPRWQWAVSTGLTPEAATLAGGLNLPTLDGESMQLFGPTNSDLDQWANVEGVSFATQSAAYKEHYGCCSGLLALFVFRAWMIVPRAFVYVVQLATRAFWALDAALRRYQVPFPVAAPIQILALCLAVCKLTLAFCNATCDRRSDCDYYLNATHNATLHAEAVEAAAFELHVVAIYLYFLWPLVWVWMFVPNTGFKGLLMYDVLKMARPLQKASGVCSRTNVVILLLFGGLLAFLDGRKLVVGMSFYLAMLVPLHVGTKIEYSTEELTGRRIDLGEQFREAGWVV